MASALAYIVYQDTDGTELSVVSSGDAEWTVAYAPSKAGYILSGWQYGDIVYEAESTSEALHNTLGSVIVNAVWEADPTYAPSCSVLIGRPIPSRKMVDEQIDTKLSDYYNKSEVESYVDDCFSDLVNSRY